MRRTALILTLTTLLATPAFGQSNPCNPCDGKAAVNPCFAKMGTVFYVDDPMARNTVTFTSEAPLEDIVGTTAQIKGYLVFDPAKPDKGGRGELMVPVKSLNTGIPLRDEHLQSGGWLNADTHPHIKLTITDVSGVKGVKSSSGSQSYDVKLTGELSLAGKSKNISIPGRISYLQESDMTRSRQPGNLLAARASFEIRLADFGVTGPPGMDVIGSKVGETITVDVSVVGTSAAPMMAGNPCNPCGGKAGNPCNPCGGKATNPCNPCGG